VSPSSRNALAGASVVAILAAAVIRLWVASMTFATDTEEWALTVLAARDIRAGHWIATLPGGLRAGPLESVVLTVIGLPFSESSVLAVWPILATASVATVVWALARTRLAGPWPLVAAALAVIHPASATLSAARPSAGETVTVVIGLAMLVLVERPSAQPPWWALGLLLGLGWWQSDRIVLFAIPVCVALIASGRLPSGGSALKLGAWTAAGASPWLIRALVGEGGGGLPSPPEEWGAALRSQWPDLWGRLIGASSPVDATPLIPLGVTIALIISAAMVLAASLVLARRPRARFATLLLLPVTAIAALVSDLDPLLTTALLAAPSALLIVVAVSVLPDQHRASAAIVVLAVCTLTTSLTARTLADAPVDRDDPDALAETLESAGVTAAYSDDSTALFLELSRPGIASSTAVYPDDRRDAVAREARRAAHVFWIPGDPERAAAMRDRLNAIAGPVEEFTVGAYLAVVPIVNVPPESVGP